MSNHYIHVQNVYEKCTQDWERQETTQCYKKKCTAIVDFCKGFFISKMNQHGTKID